MDITKILLNVEDTATYLNLGKTKTRELMRENNKVFVVKIGNRSYAHKILLDNGFWHKLKIRYSQGCDEIIRTFVLFYR